LGAANPKVAVRKTESEYAFKYSTVYDDVLFTDKSPEKGSPMISTVLRKARFVGAMGPAFVTHEVKTRFLGAKTLNSFTPDLFVGTGLEIGGPSAVFGSGNILPAYAAAARVDNVIFSERTRWEGDVGEGKTFVFDPAKSPGTQFILDSRQLSTLPAESYDFVLSSHMLEHTANPLKMLRSWKRLLKPNGTLLLVLPHRDSSFDHRRPVTSLSHLILDSHNDCGEDDATHFEEILKLHDLRRDPGQKSAEELERWIRANSVNRGAHHHVFDLGLSVEIVTELRFEVLTAESVLPMHIVITARKPTNDAPITNERFFDRSHTRYRTSPFASDRS
jgi:SAM-dependent methyltransferase